jgi:hypothetical protein
VDLITQTANDMLTGQLYRFSLEELVLDAGIGNAVFWADFTPFDKAITKCWMSHLWKFVSDNEIEI